MYSQCSCFIYITAECIVKHQTPFGRTTLHAAAAGDHVDIVGALLGAGAIASTQDSNGFSPMDVATSNGAFIAGL